MVPNNQSFAVPAGEIKISMTFWRAFALTRKVRLTSPINSTMCSGLVTWTTELWTWKLRWASSIFRQLYLGNRRKGRGFYRHQEDCENIRFRPTWGCVFSFPRKFRSLLRPTTCASSKWMINSRNRRKKEECSSNSVSIHEGMIQFSQRSWRFVWETGTVWQTASGGGGCGVWGSLNWINMTCRPAIFFVLISYGNAKGRVQVWSKWARQGAAYPGFPYMKQGSR